MEGLQVQKRITILFLKETFSAFLREYPGESIGFSTFAKLRPQEIALITDKHQNVCMCRHHEDVQMAIDALYSYTDDLPARADDLLKVTVCDMDKIESVLIGSVMSVEWI